MSLKPNYQVEELPRGRGRNKTLLLLKRGRWLLRVRYSYQRKLWLVTSGGVVADSKVVASAQSFDEARELAHKMAPLAWQGKLVT